MVNISFNLDDNNPLPGPADAAPAPWEEVAAGRFRPRRTRGSCVGRELG